MELINKTDANLNIALIAKNKAKSDAQKALMGRVLFMMDNMPTIEAIPKDQYEARLKADMVAMLTEIQLEIEEKENYYRAEFEEPSNLIHETAMCGRMFGYGRAKQIIQQKIDKLKKSD